MIKVNLLEGAADTRAATRATKAAAKTTQQLLMIAGGLVTLLIAIGADYFIAKAKLQQAEEDLAREQAAAAELKKNKEQKEALEKQIKSVQDRIKIIDDLQKTQQGPSALLDLINAKMPPANVLKLSRISQSKDDLVVEGVADNPDVVSEFGRGLELGSNNLFQKIALNVDRVEEDAPPDPDEPDVKKKVVKYKFTISTKYTPTLVGKPADPAATPDAAAPAAAPAKN